MGFHFKEGKCFLLIISECKCCSVFASGQWAPWLRCLKCRLCNDILCRYGGVAGN